ncbi:MAG: pimelyl-ACP methyl ester esterase [Candidatus Dactylopiibacterium carminicum]|uniref:Pimelyl-ACP methyl ester esterase n=1 Tax=Candidatus Dactylopiibacterium carminicum TaxID=857335 RepID=A0A272ETZ5_9RHOO|nr:alpha/beta fold hydrolase [Candidatus Dactylopiibacterium carminicum]KAF7599647.1 pimelyl-ACP methyl ester esterase [Candidatus Dactylopiibacterium carminicum]PAS93575.1 MAG: pimelyl-ACP methyl ester esterase [Candidatus Dactylopiibacterium carminicum]PAS97432.1 MAG: pimelyl-ACP methyl ester esterase [Candidatus Dactylopiibacterium carminicum]PAS99648.1 MAG: hypothetical protein BSR46_06670 [Candidatus Dactylopiibacterium carminicum]
MNLLCLHGWGYGGRLWQALVQALPDWQISTPDLDWRLGTLRLADDLARQLKAPTWVLGWSLGAQLALRLAQRHPQVVSGLYLIAASPRFVAGTDWPHGLAEETVMAFRQQFSRMPERVKQRFLALQVLGDVQRAQLAPLLESGQVDADDPSLPTGLEDLLTTDLRPIARPLCPIHLLHGAQDKLMPLAAARWLAERYDAPLEVLADAGHAPLFSSPEQLAARLQALVDD